MPQREMNEAVAESIERSSARGDALNDKSELKLNDD